MTNEEAQVLARSTWGDAGAALHQPGLGVRVAFIVGEGQRGGRVSGVGACWEEAFFRASVDPVAIASASVPGREAVKRGEPPWTRGRPKEPNTLALEFIASIIGGVTVRTLRQWRERNVASPVVD